MFTGATHGWARLSLHDEPSTSELLTKPGLGLKLLRDGRDSANLVATVSVDGQQSWNFFKNNFTTHISRGKAPDIRFGLKLAEATNFVFQVGLSDMARINEAGAEVQVAEPQFPFMLTFQPNEKLWFPDEYVRPFTEDLMSVPADSLLYRVLARDRPLELGGKDQHIADLVLRGRLTTSRWGDKNLFFRHQDIAEDLALRPEWEQFLDKFGPPNPGCPVLGRA